MRQNGSSFKVFQVRFEIGLQVNKTLVDISTNKGLRGIMIELVVSSTKSCFTVKCIDTIFLFYWVPLVVIFRGVLVFFWFRLLSEESIRESDLVSGFIGRLHSKLVPISKVIGLKTFILLLIKLRLIILRVADLPSKQGFSSRRFGLILPVIICRSVVLVEAIL